MMTRTQGRERARGREGGGGSDARTRQIIAIEDARRKTKKLFIEEELCVFVCVCVFLLLCVWSHIIQQEYGSPGKVANPARG